MIVTFIERGYSLGVDTLFAKLMALSPTPLSTYVGVKCLQKLRAKAAIPTILFRNLPV
jgi:hypothetical protein